ncbi:hypothetical protein SAMN05421541_1233 [Actinoplanes philippinensis]|uniref:Uncharacterized protein n=1 Tax=Actinoplanes philippinensis TaxID=35752 RepID=A0A1I2LN93_9ACTN|nr:hypothetical protein [Actinoplanes philippinensis]SFF80583.1 hypothetical protein SAMN05421541_1233 [Actinoplanes philippinensis]
MLDRDLADFGEKLRAQTGSIQAIAQTQAEHTATLAKHTATLDQHTATLDRHTAILDRHTAILDRHTAILDRHTATLDRHTAILDRHTAMHKETAGGLAKLTLDIFGLKNSMEQIVGMLDTLIARGGEQ